MVRKNGKGAARLQKEKNGTITKDELVLFDKEGMHPLVWEFFVDELEKQGATPAFAAKHFKAPGVRGMISRGYGRWAVPAAQIVENTHRSAQYATPGYAQATALAGVGKEGLKAALKKITSRKRAKSVATALTAEGGTSPFSALNPLDIQGPVASRLQDAILERGATIVDAASSLLS